MSHGNEHRVRLNSDGHEINRTPPLATRLALIPHGFSYLIDHPIGAQHFADLREERLQFRKKQHMAEEGLSASQFDRSPCLFRCSAVSHEFSHGSHIHAVHVGISDWRSGGCKEHPGWMVS